MATSSCGLTGPSATVVRHAHADVIRRAPERSRRRHRTTDMELRVSEVYQSRPPPTTVCAAPPRTPCSTSLFGDSYERVVGAKRSLLVATVVLARWHARRDARRRATGSRARRGVRAFGELARARAAASGALSASPATSCASALVRRPDRTLEGVGTKRAGSNSATARARVLNPGDQPIGRARVARPRRRAARRAHLRVPNGDPWESALLLGRGNDEDAWLSMREISRARPCARSSCSPPATRRWARNLGHESVYGIASGFRPPERTRWSPRCGTRTTRRRRASRSCSTARSRRAARRGKAARAQGAIAADPATRAPWYWAGFVLVGDPDITVPLPRYGGDYSARDPADRAHVRPAFCTPQGALKRRDRTVVTSGQFPCAHRRRQWPPFRGVPREQKLRCPHTPPPCC